MTSWLFSVIEFFAEIGRHIVSRRGSRTREMGSVSDTVAKAHDRLARAEFAQGLGLGELFRPKPIALLAEMHAIARLDVERVAEERLRAVWCARARDDLMKVYEFALGVRRNLADDCVCTVNPFRWGELAE